MARPSVAALELAAEWLDQYNGDHDENEMMGAVADWLLEHARSKLKSEANTIAVHRLAEKHGVSTKIIRMALKKRN